MPRQHPRLAVAAVLLATGAPAALVVATVGGPTIDSGAEPGRAAERLDAPPGDLVVAFDVGPVDAEVVSRVASAAQQAGGYSATRRGGSVGLRRVVRDGLTVHGPPPGYLVPMVFTAAPREAHRGVYGLAIAAVLGSGRAVVNELTAELTGVRVGDVLELRTTGDGTRTVEVGMIAADDAVGGSELLFDTAVAAGLGFVDDTGVVAWGFERAPFEAAVVGLDDRADTQVARSWDPPDPDSTISTARTKLALGEPWYRVTSDGSIVMHPDWVSRWLTDGRVLLDPVIRVSAQCHRLVVGDLSAALADVAAAGLAGEIDVANANTYGGCFVPRYSRTSGYLSRHTYGMAFDTNTTTNCLGCRPVMHCDVVRIFRRHGFAWGGNFRRPDGMHFEWVGERRDLIGYPSTYCPNVVGPGSARALGRQVLVHGPADHPHDTGSLP